MMLICVFSFNSSKVVYAAEPEIVASGDIEGEGTDISWKLDSAGLLTFSGYGAIPDATDWYDIETVRTFFTTKTVVIESGITSIGSGVFYRYLDLETIVIPETVTEISNSMCACSPMLANVYLPSSITTIGHNAFWDCESLKTLTLPKNIQEISESAFLISGIETLLVPCGFDFDITDFKKKTSTGPEGDTYYEEGDFKVEHYDHVFNEWETTKEPTSSAEGEKTRVCLCGELVETDAIEKLNDLKALAIVGIVLGAVIVINIVAFAIVWFAIKKKSWKDLINLFKKKTI